MCQLCNGTHVVHENIGFAYRTSCCPVCGPEPIEIRNARLDQLIQSIQEKEKNNEFTNNQS